MPIGCGFCGDVWVPVFWCLVVFVVVFCWLYLIGGAFKVVFWRLLALCLFCWLCLTSQDHQILRLPPKSDQPRSPIYALATKKWQAKISLSGKVRTLLNSILYISTLFNSLSLYIYFIMSVHRKFLHWTGFDIYIYRILCAMYSIGRLISRKQPTLDTLPYFLTCYILMFGFICLMFRCFALPEQCATGPAAAKSCSMSRTSGIWNVGWQRFLSLGGSFAAWLVPARQIPCCLGFCFFDHLHQLFTKGQNDALTYSVLKFCSWVLSFSPLGLHSKVALGAVARSPASSTRVSNNIGR